MTKLTTLWQSIKIEYISFTDLDKGLIKVGGEIIESNFLNKGRRSLMPIFSENTLSILSIGDIIKITLYTPKGEEDINDDGETKTLSFKDCGSKYELWNAKMEGWDKIYEIFQD